jgi:hypothetical protein
LGKDNPVASRIFITGEVALDYIGFIAGNTLLSTNDLLPDPLFILTRYNTIKMVRFNPEIIWPLICPDMICQLINAEQKRLGFTFPLNYWDFYYSLIAALYAKTGSNYCFPIFKENNDTTWYEACYLGGLLLFKKPNLMDVPITRHFALTICSKNRFKMRILNKDECRKLDHIQDFTREQKQYTNNEMDLLAEFVRNNKTAGIK